MCFCINTEATYTLDAACTTRPYYGINGTCVLPPTKKKNKGLIYLGYVAAAVVVIGFIIWGIFKLLKHCNCNPEKQESAYNFTQMFQL